MDNKEEIKRTRWGNWEVREPSGGTIVFADHQKALDYLRATKIDTKEEWRAFWNKYPL